MLSFSMGRQGWKGDHKRHSSAAKRGWKKRRQHEPRRLRTVLQSPRATAASRFDAYGIDDSGGHVTEYKNADLSNDELVMKYNSFRDARSSDRSDQLRIISRELENRGVFTQPND